MPLLRGQTDVYGDTDISGYLTVEGAFHIGSLSLDTLSISNLSVSESLTVCGSLVSNTLDANSSTLRSLTVTGNETVRGSMTVCGSLIGSTATVSSLTVTGNETVNGNLTVCGSLITSGNTPRLTITQINSAGTYTLTNGDSGKVYFIHGVSSGDISLNLPSSPTLGTYYKIIMGDFNGSSNSFHINGGGYLTMRGLIRYGNSSTALKTSNVSSLAASRTASSTGTRSTYGSSLVAHRSGHMMPTPSQMPTITTFLRHGAFELDVPHRTRKFTCSYPR